MTEPRNVTPGSEDRDWDDWSRWSWVGRGRSFPWLGVLLVLVGAGLLIQYFVPDVSTWTLVLSAIAVACLLGFAFGGSRAALILGLLIGALAVARLIGELGVYSGPGTSELALATAFLAIWIIDLGRGRRSSWPVWGVAIFGLIGLVQISGRLVVIPELGALWPVLIIGLGLLIMLSARRSAPPPPARP